MPPSKSKALEKYHLRIIFCGNTGVGKTSMIYGYTENAFSTTYVSTIGIDFKIKNITLDGKQIKLQIWDTGGQERYDAITPHYIRGAMGAFIVYDVTNEQSFNDVPKWMEMCRRNGLEDLEVMLIGNKCDRIDDRQVSTTTGRRAAVFNQTKFMETSAKSFQNIYLAFEEMTKAVLAKHLMKIERQTIHANGFKLVCQDPKCRCPDHNLQADQNSKKDSKGCCSVI